MTAAGRRLQRGDLPAAVGIGLPLVIGLLHVALVAPHYFVGSFDDDAAYVLAAKGLLAGVGLTGHLPSGEVMVGLFPPGYSAILAPLVWVWPHSFAPLRLLSVACYAGLFPLVWIWLRRKGMKPALRALVLLLLALGPPLATYGSMVMAETPYLVVLVLLLLAVDRWRTEHQVVSRWALATVVLASGLIWLKQAGIGFVAGLVLWLALGRSPRRWARAGLLVGGVAITLVPVVVARLSTGVPLAGARYSEELGGFYQGGLVKRFLDVVPPSTWHLFSTAIPATVVPYLEPLPIAGHWATLWKVVSWQVTLLAALGALLWARRHRDGTLLMTVVYLAECVMWPFVNERRAILILPLLAAWYVTGAAWLWEVLRRKAASPHAVRAARTAGLSLAAVAVAAPLIAQMPRDYLYGWNQNGSHFGGSRYAAVLRQLGRPSDVVETDYQSSTALFTGHVTNWSAFTASDALGCYGPGVLGTIKADDAGFLLLADVNKPGQLDSPCLQSLTLVGDWAVPILHTRRDDASVFELVGPGTGHPDLVDTLPGAGTGAFAVAGSTSTLAWTFARPEAVSQLSVGQAASDVGTTGDVRLEVRHPDGAWSTVAMSRSAVGDGPGRAPYLLARLDAPQTVTGVRVVVEGTPTDAGAIISDVAALGPA